MKNKILKFGILLLILLLSLVTFCGCGEDDSSDDEEENIENITNLKNHTEKQIVENKNEDDLYFKVLNNKLSYVNENNEKTLFSEYMKNFEGDTKTTVKYTLLDLDEDKKQEMIIFIETFDGFYLILNNENGTIYGFEDVLRGMLQIKEDGTYSASGGAESNAILKCKFNKTERIVETLAEEDYGKYAINGKDVDNSEYSNYLEEFKNKKDVEFVTYIENYDFTSTTSNNNPSSEGNIQTNSDFKTGTYIMIAPSLVGTEAEGYDTTLAFTSGNVKYTESYWEREKNGTYTVNGDTLTIEYTSGVEANSITGNEAVSLNETEVYKIEGSKIIMQSTTRDSYYTAGSTIYELK